VLVTITAGMNLGIGEFEEVGEIVNAIAPRSSTIVIGTVIEVDMIDELHVTIIATGIA
jgi:cell division protein FtsZ